MLNSVSSTCRLERPPTTGMAVIVWAITCIASRWCAWTQPLASGFGTTSLYITGSGDYDPPAAPNLIDIVVNGKPIKAVAQPTKQGFLFVFDRITGKPVWPIEERAVAPSDIPGERASATQPFPTRPAAFARQGISTDDLVDFTPELRAQALALVAPYRMGSLYTPPSLQGTLQLPGWGGGANWTGAAFDPESQRLYLPTTDSSIVVKNQQTRPTSQQLQVCAQPRNHSSTRSRGSAFDQTALFIDHCHRYEQRRAPLGASNRQWPAPEVNRFRLAGPGATRGRPRALARC